MVTNQDSGNDKTVCEQDLENLKHQCKKIFFTFSKIVEDLVEQIDEETGKKKVEQKGE